MTTRTLQILDRSATIALGLGLGWILLSRFEAWCGALAWSLVGVGALARIILSSAADRQVRRG